MGLRTGNSFNLYDENTGRLVGFLDLNGEEQLLEDAVSGVSLDQFNALTDVVNTQGSAISALQGEVGAWPAGPTIAATLTALALAVGPWSSPSDITTTIGTIEDTLVTLQDDIAGISLSSADAIVGAFNDGTTDNLAIVTAALGPAGSFATANKTRAEFATGGNYKIAGLVDLHPSISLEMDARGGKLVVPGNNLSGTTANFVGITDTSVGHVYGGGAYGAGAAGAFFRGVRLSPGSGSNLAWQLSMGGFNVDFRGTSQANGTHALRWPNPDNTENLIDGDPLYTGNKDYTAPKLHDMDWVGGPGSGIVIEAGNGRFHADSVRAMSFAGHGYDLGGNDVVMNGHSAAGSCGSGATGGFGIKAGLASGFLATTMNVWGCPANRSWKTGAVWILRRSFAVGFCVLNDFVRFDGASNWDQGGVFCANSYATHDENFADECVAINVLADGDLRAQCNNTIANYRALAFVGNAYYKSTKVLFPTWQNIGGSLDGKGGTSYPVIYDVNSNAAINCIDTINSDPECKPWGAFAQAFTVTGATTTQITSTAHGLRNQNRVCFKPGTLPAPLLAGVTYWVNVVDVDHFHVRNTPNGANISITSNGSGTFASLSTLPYGTRGSSTANFILMDAGKAEVRIGAAGNGNPGRVNLMTVGGDEGLWSDRTGAVTFTYNTNGSDYTFNATAHGLPENAPVRLLSSGTLPGGFLTSVQYSARNVTTNSFQLAASPGGNLITATTSAGSGSHTFNSWYFTYGFEAGDKTRHSKVPQRHGLWGAFEFDCAPSAMPGSWQRVAGMANGDTLTINPYEPYAFAAGGTVAGITVNLPTGMATSYRLSIYLNINAGITWGGGFALNGGSPALPTTVTGWGELELDYLADSGEWNVASWNTLRGWVALTDGATIATPSFTVPTGQFSVTFGGNRTLQNPTGSKDGQRYTWLITQDATGSRLITFGSKFKFPGGTPTLSTAANAVDKIDGVYNAAANGGAGVLYCEIFKGYA